MNKSDITIDKLQKAIANLGYEFFVNGDYNLNIIGIRSADNTANTFNDFISLVYKVDGEFQLKVYAVTTDPGIYYRENPRNVKGVAILAPAQHRGCFQLGKHQGKYKALVQAKEVPVLRDNNRDQVLDYGGGVDIGFHGINIHRASDEHTSSIVNRWSEGCQVFANPDDFSEFIDLCEKSTSSYGSTLTYTLIEEENLS